MAMLKVLRGSTPQPQYAVCVDRAVLGRDRSCNIWLPRQDVSRQHAVLVRTADGYEIIDCGSHNGTRLNGQPIRPQQPYPLDDHDRIQIGAIVFSFEIGSDDGWTPDPLSCLEAEQLTGEMVLSPTHQKAVDAECDQFEERWNSDVEPKIEDHLVAWQDAQYTFLRRTLLQELVQVDLEYRWRGSSEASSGDGHDENVHSSPTRDAIGDARSSSDVRLLPSRPLVEDYLREFPDLGDQAVPPTQQLRLIATEYRVRQQWGDRPRYLDMRRRFPGLDRSLERVLRGIALKLTPVIVRFDHEEVVVFSRRFSAPVELGRQREGDPPPYGRVTNESTDRIVVAPASDLLVSRTHLFLDIAAKDEFLVENRSQKLDLLLDGGETLPPGESRYLSVPLGITLGKVTVCVTKR